MKNKFLLMTIAILIIAMNTVAQVTGTFIDSRGNKTYKTDTIGKQIWMAENLAYKASSGCWAYNDDITNVIKYGYLYNWETAKTVCPTGWHLPNDAEWTTFTDYLGGESIAGGKLKSTTGWNSPNIGANNGSGFTALPGGYHYSNGTFDHIGENGYFWSSTDGNAGNAWSRGVSFNYGGVSRSGNDKENGFSVRCISDK